jgi:nicotinamide mononucleotide transporter
MIFYDAKLYADMGLQGIFFAFSIYGWYAWTKGTQDYSPDSSPLKVQQSTAKEMSIGIVTALSFALLLGYVLQNQTDADYPYIDSVLASLSLLAQLFQTRKRLENWYLWIIIDAAYILIYTQKVLYLSAFLYSIFLILAIQGSIEWKKALWLSTKNLAE